MAIWVVLAGILVAIAAVWAANIVNSMWVRPRRMEKHLRRQGLRGNPYRLFTGDIKENYSMIRQALSKPINIGDDIALRCIPFYHRMINLGYNFVWMGPIPRVFITNPAQIKEILSKNYEFRKSVTNPVSRLLITGLVDHEGEKWAKHRKLINPAFHQEKLKKMLPAFYESCRGLVVKWQNLVSENGSCEVDVWPCFSSLTSDVISRTAFGSSYEEGKRIFQLLDELLLLTTQALQSAYFPGFRFVPTKLNKRMWNVDKEVKAALKVIINRREEAMRKGEAANDDLLGILMESNHREIKEHGNDHKCGMNLADVIDECKIFYLAGQETTSVLLVWTMVLLGHHSDWQARAREEVMSVFGQSKPVEFEGLNRLKIVTMILYEVLRLYPPANAIIRAVSKETKLGDLLVPAGAQLIVPTLLVHQDPELWGEDAKEFKPERFAEGVSKAASNQVSYLPFGWGPRICVGQNFALLEAKMALAMILQSFSFELSPTYTHAPHNAFSLRPQHGAHLILHKI
uniref:Cytochrome P450 CYP72-1 n=1 Tax=Daphne genkwa TaxID=1477590 RepID=A0A977LGA9_9ROSI|nr:cytochrome P450 CYP72-1 [Daphne genkwa]